MKRSIARLGFLLFASCASSAESFEFLKGRKLSPIEIEFGRYIAEFYDGFFYAPFVEEVGAGDVLDMQTLRQKHSREFCFPGSDEPKKQPIRAISNNKSYDISGAFEAKVGLSLGAKVELRERIVRQFRQAETRSFRQIRLVDDSKCAEVAWMKHYVGPELLVRTILYLQGNISQELIVDVDGQISVDLKDKIVAFLGNRFGEAVSKLDLEGALAGGIRNESGDSIEFLPLTASAFMPEYVSQSAVTSYNKVFGNPEEYSQLRAAEGDGERAAAYFARIEEEYGYSVEKALSSFFELYGGEEVTPFSKEDVAQVSAIEVALRLFLLASEVDEA
ncbi:MAG: hypothetical protein AAF662_00030 [Pseudomonadota bacterium]